MKSDTDRRYFACGMIHDGRMLLLTDRGMVPHVRIDPAKNHPVDFPRVLKRHFRKLDIKTNPKRWIHRLTVIGEEKTCYYFVYLKPSCGLLNSPLRRMGLELTSEFTGWIVPFLMDARFSAGTMSVLKYK